MKKTFFYCLIALIIAITFILTKPVLAGIRQLPLGGQCREDNGQPVLNSRGEILDCAFGMVCVYEKTPSPPATTAWNCQQGLSSVDIFGKIELPNPIKSLGFGAAGISKFLSNIVELIFIAAAIIFLFMILISSLQWILSGGDKEAIGKARARLTYAIIGIIILSLAFLIAQVLGEITGFTFFQDLIVAPQADAN